MSFLFPRQIPSLGKKGEKKAAEYLRKKGFQILEMNYKNPKGRQLGEIDIIAKNGKEIVFVEVKTRKGGPGIVFPEDNLTPEKLRKLERVAEYYLQSNKLLENPYHFDAIAVSFDQKDCISVRHFEHIFV